VPQTGICRARGNIDCCWRGQSYPARTAQTSRGKPDTSMRGQNTPHLRNAALGTGSRHAATGSAQETGAPARPSGRMAVLSHCAGMNPRQSRKSPNIFTVAGKCRGAQGMSARAQAWPTDRLSADQPRRCTIRSPQRYTASASDPPPAPSTRPAPLAPAGREGGTVVRRQ
jgi:hypothetical protein